MKIERAAAEHVGAWAELRAELWPGETPEQHRADVAETFLSGTGEAAAFVCLGDDGTVIGIAEAALRKDYVNGCETSPVLFLEGIYVRPEHRRSGVGKLLCGAVARWGCSLGCQEFASDAAADNADSLRFHAALGFDETERVVFFRRVL